jgi:hypothetical protein
MGWLLILIAVWCLRDNRAPDQWMRVNTDWIDL